nr:uncharacterized protein LOC114096299 [Marmota flaviventris]
MSPSSGGDDWRRNCGCHGTRTVRSGASLHAPSARIPQTPPAKAAAASGQLPFSGWALQDISRREYSSLPSSKRRRRTGQWPSARSNHTPSRHRYSSPHGRESTSLPVPFKGPTVCGSARARKVKKGVRGRDRGERGWSAAAPLKRGGGKSGRRCFLFFFSAARDSGSARRTRVGGEGGRPGRGAGAFAATRTPSLSCVLREVERARGSGGDYFAASFGSRQRRV